MLERVAVHMWMELAMLPAAVDEDGAVCRVTSKCRSRLEEAFRPWVEEARKRQDQDIANQWYSMYGPGSENNPATMALRKQQLIIAGLEKAEE